MAIITLAPLGNLLRFKYLATFVSTNGFCGYDKIFVNVSYLMLNLVVGTPTACLPIAD